MRKHVYGILAGVLIVGVAQANLIVNPGFEDPTHTNNDGTDPVGWTVIESTTGSRPERQIRTRNNALLSGSMGLQIGAGQSDHDGELWQAVPTTLGEVYTFEMWARAFTASNNPQNQNVQIDLRDGTGTAGSVLDSFDTGGTLTDTWQLFSINVTAASSAMTIHISDVSDDFGAPASDSNDVVLDDLSLVLIPEPTTMALFGIAGMVLFLRRRHAR